MKMISSSKNRRQAYDVMELMKKKRYTESSSTLGQRTQYTLSHARKIKTLPQADWHEIEEVTAQLKATLPSLAPFEVRRLRMPYHEAILLELEEQGYEEAARNLRRFLALDEETKREAELVPSVPKRLYLTDEKDLIDYLKDGLVAFEEAKIKNDPVALVDALLDLAHFFQSKTWQLWWITENLYLQALATAEQIKTDSRQTITLIQYIYGRFLLQKC